MIVTPIAPGFWLDQPAAASYARMRAAGCPAGITQAGRTFAQQVAMYAAYLAGRLVATAAVPGTSKHEKGNALDVPEPARSWIRANGASFGWIKDLVRNEPWHDEYQLARDQHLADVRPAPTPINPKPTPEDDMSAAGEAAILASLSNIETILAGKLGIDNGIRGDVQTVGIDVLKTHAWVGTVADELRALAAALGHSVPPAA